MLNGPDPCARSSGAGLQLSCVLRACPALAGTTMSEAPASSAGTTYRSLDRQLPLIRMPRRRPDPAERQQLRHACVLAAPVLEQALAHQRVVPIAAEIGRAHD